MAVTAVTSAQCPRCAKRLAAGVRFCPRCGMDLGVNPPRVDRTPPPVAVRPTPPAVPPPGPTFGPIYSPPRPGATPARRPGPARGGSGGKFAFVFFLLLALAGLLLWVLARRPEPTRHGPRGTWEAPAHVEPSDRPRPPADRDSW